MKSWLQKIYMIDVFLIFYMFSCDLVMVKIGTLHIKSPNSNIGGFTLVFNLLSCILSCSLFFHEHLLTTEQMRKTIMKESCWTISNITGAREQVSVEITLDSYCYLLPVSHFTCNIT
jgi:hypothetical protein